MRSKTPKDPRLADITSLKSNPAPDMPVPGRREKRKTKVERAQQRQSMPKLPSLGRHLIPILALAAVCYTAYWGVTSVNATLQKNQQQRAITDVWRQLLLANVTIEGTPMQFNKMGSSEFPSVSFEHARSKQELHRNLRLAAALPGIKDIGLTPISTRTIGSGFCDDETLQLVVDKFPDIRTLNLSGSRVTMLESAVDLPIVELNLVNVPIKRDKLSTLQLFSSVETLNIGWDQGSRDPEHEVFYTKTYRKRLLEVISRMPSLRDLNLYEMTLTGEELKEMSGIKVMNIRGSGS